MPGLAATRSKLQIPCDYGTADKLSDTARELEIDENGWNGVDVSVSLADTHMRSASSRYGVSRRSGNVPNSSRISISNMKGSKYRQR